MSKSKKVQSGALNGRSCKQLVGREGEVRAEPDKDGFHGPHYLLVRKQGSKQGSHKLCSAF